MNDERPLDVTAALAAMLAACDELAAAWRRRFSVSANEEIVLRSMAHGVTSPTQLSHTLGMTTAGMTNLLDRLEREGLVRRERHERDGRRVLVTPTKKGFQLWRELEAAYEDVGTLSDGLSAAERAVVARFLGDVTREVNANAAALDKQ